MHTEFMNPYTNNFANISNYARRMGTRGDFATLSHPPSVAILCLNYCFSSSLTDLPLASASCTKLTKRGFFYFFFSPWLWPVLVEASLPFFVVALARAGGYGGLASFLPPFPLFVFLLAAAQT